MAACAAFVEESRMKLANAMNIDRKSGGMGHPGFVRGENSEENLTNQERFDDNVIRSASRREQRKQGSRVGCAHHSNIS